MRTAHALAVRGDDCYETPEVATEALLRAEKLPTTIWEPACGPGAIVRVLRSHPRRLRHRPSGLRFTRSGSGWLGLPAADAVTDRRPDDTDQPAVPSCKPIRGSRHSPLPEGDHACPAGVPRI